MLNWKTAVGSAAVVLSGFMMAFWQQPSSAEAIGVGENGTTQTAPAVLPSGLVHRIKALPDKVADTSSLKSIVESVTRGAKTNDEKAIAIYNFAILANYHRNYPDENGGVEALKLYNVYGWALCGGLHSGLAALWREMGWQWRFVGWNNPGHTTVEVNYDGKWHYFDTFLKFYVWRKDANAPGGRTVASQEDIKRDPSLIKELVYDPARKVYYHKDNQFENINEHANWTAPAFLVCGDEPAGILTGVNSSNQAGSPTSWESIKFDGPYSTDVNLSPGYGLELDWSAQPDGHWWNGATDVPGHTCGDKDYRNSPVLGPVLEPYAEPDGPARSYANGVLTFTPDFSSSAFLSSLAGQENVKWANGKLAPEKADQPASITIRLQSPYVMSKASGSVAGADRVELSTDSGKTWKEIHLKNFSSEAGGCYDVLVKLTFRTVLSALNLAAVVEHNRSVAPYLSPGRNRVTVSAEDAKELGSNRLLVTYVYELGSRSKSYEQLADMSAELGRAHYARWSNTPTVVQKSFASKDLPATFNIDIPTPEGKYPVYPRMLFLRREIVGPGSKPLPLPDGAVAAAPAQANQLVEMPNPFLIGLSLPPVKVQRPMETRRIALAASHVVNMKGEVFPLDQLLRWTKDNQEAWVMLVGGSLKDLPRAGDIAAARLVLSILGGHEKAPTRVGVVELKAPFEPGKGYDFKNFGELAGTAVLDQQPAGLAAYIPPKEFKIDITRNIKMISAGETTFNGYAIRVIPDRSVDDGWTVKFHMPKQPTVLLELDVYTDKPKTGTTVASNSFQPVEGH